MNYEVGYYRITNDTDLPPIDHYVKYYHDPENVIRSVIKIDGDHVIVRFKEVFHDDVIGNDVLWSFWKYKPDEISFCYQPFNDFINSDQCGWDDETITLLKLKYQ